MSTRTEHREHLAVMNDAALFEECVTRYKLAADERRRRSKDRPQSELDQLCYQECGSRGRLDIYDSACLQAREELTEEAKVREGRS